MGRLGNAKVSSILGPRLDVNHLSLAKMFPVGERVRATFTSTFTNIFNHPLFYDPDTYINASDAGQLVWARADTTRKKRDTGRSRSSCVSNFNHNRVTRV